MTCFLALHETKFDPMNIAKLPVDHLSSRHPAQSTSEKALNRVDNEYLNMMPSFKVSLTYRRILLTTVR
jgi:hypothetical protein